MSSIYEYGVVEVVYYLCYLRGGAGGYLLYLLNRVLFVAGVDSLRGVSGIEVFVVG